MVTESSRAWCAALWLLFAIGIPLVLQHNLYTASLAASEIAYDTAATYIPLAKRFLQEGAALFASPEHLVVAPGSYLYMAALGADAALVVQANLLLSALLLLLVADTVRRLAGPVAACAAAWLMACSPLLPEVLVPALSEPPHLFLIALWLWTASLIWTGRRHWSLIVLGAVALFSAILVRATYLYWLPAAIGAAVLLLFTASPQLRVAARSMLIMHLLAALLTAGWCAQNYVKFGVPAIATGSGAALYFGSNAAIDGYEPPYYGMLHDHWLIAGEHSHLSIEGDRRLKTAALAVYRDMPAATFASMALQKLGATLFFSQATLLDEPFNQRSWRIALVMLALVGLWGYRRSPFIWMLGCVILYHLAIMSLVMHNARYSIGAIEVPLTLAAALGVARLLSRPFSGRRLAGFSVLVVMGIAAGVYQQRSSPPLMPMLEKGHYLTVLRASPERLESHGFAGNPLAAEGGQIEAAASILWPGIRFHRLGGTPIVSFRINKLDPACTHVMLQYSAPDEPVLQQTTHVRGLQFPQEVNLGTLALNSLGRADTAAALRLSFLCPPGAQVAIEDLQLRYLTTAHHYRDQLQSVHSTEVP